MSKRSRTASNYDVEISSKKLKEEYAEENSGAGGDDDSERSKCAIFGRLLWYFFTPSPESRFKAKHSLDSDEEDDVKEVERKGLGDEDLSAQEAATIVRYLCSAS